MIYDDEPDDAAADETPDDKPDDKPTTSRPTSRRRAGERAGRAGDEPSRAGRDSRTRRAAAKPSRRAGRAGAGKADEPEKPEKRRSRGLPELGAAAAQPGHRRRHRAGGGVGLRTFVVAPYYIPSASMEPTLHGCPRLQRRPRAGRQAVLPTSTIRDRGDIVVFDRPASWHGATDKRADQAGDRRARRHSCSCATARSTSTASCSTSRT